MTWWQRKWVRAEGNQDGLQALNARPRLSWLMWVLMLLVGFYWCCFCWCFFLLLFLLFLLVLVFFFLFLFCLCIVSFFVQVKCISVGISHRVDRITGTKNEMLQGILSGYWYAGFLGTLQNVCGCGYYMFCCGIWKLGCWYVCFNLFLFKVQPQAYIKIEMKKKASEE